MTISFEAESVLREIEQECSIKILDIYESNEILQENKSDGSPVAAADLAANEIIKNSLNRTFHIQCFQRSSSIQKIFQKHFGWLIPLTAQKNSLKKRINLR